MSGRPVPRPCAPRRPPATLVSQVTEGGTPGRLRARPPRLGVHAHPAVPTLPAARGPPRGPLSGSWRRNGRASGGATGTRGWPRTPRPGVLSRGGPVRSLGGRAGSPPTRGMLVFSVVPFLTPLSVCVPPRPRSPFTESCAGDCGVGDFGRDVYIRVSRRLWPDA